MDGNFGNFPDELTKIVTSIFEENIDIFVSTRTKNLRGQHLSLTHFKFFIRLVFDLLVLLPCLNFNHFSSYSVPPKHKPLIFKNISSPQQIVYNAIRNSLLQSLSYVETPVNYHYRIDTSKVSRTIKDSIFAGIKNRRLDFQTQF